MDGDSLGQKSRQSSPRKLFSRGKSPEQTSPSRGSPSKSLDGSLEFAAMSYEALSRSASTEESNSVDPRPHSMVTDDSELDLSLRLELARHNSLTQPNNGPSQQRGIQPEDTIPEGWHTSLHLCGVCLTFLLQRAKIHQLFATPPPYSSVPFLPHLHLRAT